jgi:signal transduction histidine kinase
LGVRTTAAKARLLFEERRPRAAIERHGDAFTTATLERAFDQAASGATVGRSVTTDNDVSPATNGEAAVRRLNAVLDSQSARIAAVLHDDASQVLAAAHMSIEEVAEAVPPAAQARLHRIRQHLHEVADQLRRISHDLHPGIVDDLGPTDAIKCIARAFTRRSGVPLAVKVDLDEPCSATAGSVAFRFVEEALSNIGRHAGARSASVAVVSDGSHVQCTVCDDGAGFDAAALDDATPCGLGLRLLRARVEAIGGTLDITSAPQQGTRLRVLIPLER